MNKLLKDKFTLGFIAGVIAFILPFIWNQLSKFIFGFSDLTFADFASVLIYGKFPKSIPEYIFAVLVEIFWNGLLGVVFAFLLKQIGSRNLLFKGWCYAFTVWFFSYVITYLFQVPELAEITLNTVISNAIGATLHGIILGYIFNYLDKKPSKSINP